MASRSAFMLACVAVFCASLPRLLSIGTTMVARPIKIARTTINSIKLSPDRAVADGRMGTLAVGIKRQLSCEARQRFAGEKLPDDLMLPAQTDSFGARHQGAPV